MSVSAEAHRHALRTLMRRRRSGLSQQHQQRAAQHICEQANRHAALLAAQHIALYRAFNGEIETRLLCRQLWQQQKQLYLPRLHPTQAGTLLFAPYQANTPLQRNRFGILEPSGYQNAVCQLQQLEVVILPLVAFDQHGYRLGMGGGYYDRTLGNYAASVGEQHAPYTIGLAHDCQQVEGLPYAAWDLRLSAIMTPHHLFSI